MPELDGYTHVSDSLVHRARARTPFPRLPFCATHCVVFIAPWTIIAPSCGSSSSTALNPHDSRVGCDNGHSTADVASSPLPDHDGAVWFITLLIERTDTDVGSAVVGDAVVGDSDVGHPDVGHAVVGSAVVGAAVVVVGLGVVLGIPVVGHAVDGAGVVNIGMSIVGDDVVVVGLGVVELS